MSLLSSLKPENVPANALKKGELRIQREITVQYLYLILTAACVLLTLLSLAPSIKSGNMGSFIGLIVFTLCLIGLTIFRNIPYGVRAILFLLFIFTVALYEILRTGISGQAQLMILAFPIMVTILFGLQPGYISLASALAFTLGMGLLMTNHIISLPDPSTISSFTDFSLWVGIALSILLVAFIIMSAIRVFFRGFNHTLAAQSALVTDLEKERTNLEERIEQRTRDLARKAAQLEAARQVSSGLATEADIDQLLNNSVNVICQQFNYYHAGIFLSDENNEYALLRAATGEAGQKMLERGHRLRIGEIGIVGHAIASSTSSFAQNVEEDVNYFKNPLLPETRAELAVPLRAGGKVIGALDVQSKNLNAFTPEDISVLQTLADQLALAFQKANLLQQLQQNISELEASYRQITQKAWHNYLKNSRRRYSYRYAQSKLGTEVVNSPESEKALQSGQSVLTGTPQKESGAAATSTLAVPIKLRNQTLGVINLHFDSPSITQDMMTLVESATNRMAISLENARLLEELQFRAERERMVGEISSKVRGATEVEDILRIAAGELGSTLGVSEVVVQLNSND